jgi:predicted DNA-binding WGR domain protein
MNQGIRLRWEKPTARGVRYYEVDLHRDLWGEWLLVQVWGRRGTRLGQVRVASCGSHAEGLAQIAAIVKRRRQRCYVMVAGADPRGEKRAGRRSKPTDTGAAGQGTAESARGMPGRSA